MNVTTSATTAATSTQASAGSIPTAWLDDRDVPFFRLVNGVFDAAFVEGAGVLLASYDDDSD